MKTKLFIIITVIIAITALFGWRYYYLPNVVMAKRAPVDQKNKVSFYSDKKVIDKVKPSSVINMRTESKVVEKPNILKNGSFNNKLKNWQLWNAAKTFSKTVKFINVNGGKFKNAVRIENPMKKLVGIQQQVSVESNTVYKLSGIAKSTVAINNNIIFGGRIGFYLPPQKEKQIVWMSECNQWWKKDLIFTNLVTGIATVYVHMGYGGIASTGEFTNISLEKIVK
ncbi:MAG: hypothetical protein DRI44_07210 [Chlamydiae bacterium]|nr:MAG: hypothetical protein DRI44_07210 [Chlamydiota bacterium]